MGRVCQFNMKVVHDGFKNLYSFIKDRNLTLTLFSPKQVCKDQLKLKRKSKAEESENVVSF